MIECAEYMLSVWSMQSGISDIYLNYIIIIMVTAQDYYLGKFEGQQADQELTKVYWK